MIDMFTNAGIYVNQCAKIGCTSLLQPRDGQRETTVRLLVDYHLTVGSLQVGRP